jgi:large subunit ribosomal protein L21
MVKIGEKFTLSAPEGHGSLSPLFLRENFMAYAIFKTGGKQYRAAQGDVIEIEKLDAEPGSETTFSEVLFIGEGSKITTGADLKGSCVVAEVVEQFKGPKLISFKYRRRKGYHRTVGHRQKLTRVKIKSITA